MKFPHTGYTFVGKGKRYLNGNNPTITTCAKVCNAFVVVNMCV
jgi:hypothetical protein